MANIFQQYAQPARSVMDYQADYDAQDMRRVQLGAAQRTNEIAGLTAEQTRQTMAESTQERNVLRQLAAQYGGDDKGFTAALGSSGLPGLMKRANERQKEALDRDNVQSQIGERSAKAKKDEAEVSEKGQKQLLQQVAALNSPDDATALINYGVAKGNLPEAMAVGMRKMVATDPRWQLNLMLGIGDPSKMIELLKPHLQTVNAGNAQVQQAVDPRTGAVTEIGRTAINQSPDNAATQATSLAGQRSVAATAAAARDQSASQFTATQAAGKWTYDSERGGQVNTQTGEFRPATQGGAPLGPKDKPLTEGQAKAALFGARMEASDKIIKSLAAGGAEASAPGSRSGYGVGSVVTAVSSAKLQQLDQAKRDFINATLRRESGAVISDGEFDNAEKQYFPQIGDSAEVKTQKASNRAIAVRGVQAEVPNAAKVVKGIIGSEAPASGGGVPAAKVVKFLGFE